jgi:hypothetical protein
MGVKSYSYGGRDLSSRFYSFKRASSHPILFATASVYVENEQLSLSNPLFNAFQGVQIDCTVVGVLARSRLSRTIWNCVSSCHFVILRDR